VNVHGRGGWRFFVAGPDETILAFLIHEFAHAKVSDHFSREFYEECCRLGAALTLAVHADPDLMVLSVPTDADLLILPVAP
jgi:hypothetical protein